MKTNEQLGQPVGSGEVRLIRYLPGPIERVWDFLTDPEKRARWFAGGPIEPRKGGTITLNFRNANLGPGETPPDGAKEFHDPGASMAGTITRWEPPHVLAYTFGETGESLVTFELSVEGANVRLVLTHRATGEDLPYLPGFAAGWHTHLAHLLSLLEGTPRPPFWPMHARLREQYARILGAS